LTDTIIADVVWSHIDANFGWNDVVALHLVKPSTILVECSTADHAKAVAERIRKDLKARAYFTMHKGNLPFGDTILIMNMPELPDDSLELHDVLAKFVSGFFSSSSPALVSDVSHAPFRYMNVTGVSFKEGYCMVQTHRKPDESREVAREAVRKLNGLKVLGRELRIIVVHDGVDVCGPLICKNQTETPLNTSASQQQEIPSAACVMLSGRYIEGMTLAELMKVCGSVNCQRVVPASQDTEKKVRLVFAQFAEAEKQYFRLKKSLERHGITVQFQDMYS
jgi:hypothetical protein